MFIKFHQPYLLFLLHTYSRQDRLTSIYLPTIWPEAAAYAAGHDYNLNIVEFMHHICYFTS